MASKRRIRRKSCEGKQQYPNEATAREAAYHASGRSKSRIEAYPCKVAHGTHWHIGHPPGKVRRAQAHAKAQRARRG